MTVVKNLYHKKQRQKSFRKTSPFYHELIPLGLHALKKVLTYYQDLETELPFQNL